MTSWKRTGPLLSAPLPNGGRLVTGPAYMLFRPIKNVKHIAAFSQLAVIHHQGTVRNFVQPHVVRNHYHGRPGFFWLTINMQNLRLDGYVRTVVGSSAIRVPDHTTTPSQSSPAAAYRLTAHEDIL